jgi:hypothetical protein
MRMSPFASLLLAQLLSGPLKSGEGKADGGSALSTSIRQMNSDIDSLKREFSSLSDEYAEAKRQTDGGQVWVDAGRGEDRNRPPDSSRRR